MKYTVAIAALLLSACAPAQVASTGEAPVAAAEKTATYATLTGEKPIIIAHRGASFNAPENPLSARI